jgi:hypothetical protein
MTTWRTSVLAAAGLACLALCACARQSTTEESTSRPAQTNPSNFPLYPGTTLVEVAPIDYGTMFAMIRKNDPSAKPGENYRGHEIIVSTSASIPQLRTWVAKLKTAPPLGFHYSPSTAAFSIGPGSSERSSAEVDALFETANSQRIVFVIALDPKRIRAQLGPALDVADNYKALPPMLRAPIDDQMKQQLGYTVSELLDRHSPIGMIFATLKTMSTADRRAIVLVDESKTVSR